jgi:hypothetical protein
MNIKESTLNTASERFEKRLAEIKVDISNAKTEMIKWMFIFWIGQIAVLFGIIAVFLR